MKPHNPQIQPHLLSPSAVAALIGVSKTTIARWVKESRFPAFVRIGDKRIAFFREDVDSWLKDLRQQHQQGQ